MLFKGNMYRVLSSNETDSYHSAYTMPILQNTQLRCGVSWCENKGGTEHRAV
uniref:Uncharacterized protein n=1 Tax=Arundo donax TaxID=35708 RepID=A0A0A9CW18_ARUDO